jgi:putative peptidoglycan lipid II flippase
LQIRIRFSSPQSDRTEPSSPLQRDNLVRFSARKPPEAAKPSAGKGGRAALLVGAGILVSRISGLIRERVIAHYFGDSAVADAFRAAIRIPNLLNNLFGEGVLSASFVTVYSKLRAQGESEEADRLAGAVFGLLSLACAVLVALGVLSTPLLINIVAPGFRGDKRELTIQMVRILFPGTGLLVMSAWCLGILNSHRRFFLSYAAPVAVNVVMIATLIGFGRFTDQDRLAVYLAWSSVAGCAVQFLIQLPRALQLVSHFQPVVETASESIQIVIRNFGPVFLSRGVVQVSAYIDSIIASMLPNGAVAALGYGQTISLLPVSLFSMSVSAAELPSLSSASGTEDEIAEFLRWRLQGGLRRIAFFVVPSAVAFLFLGDIVAGALYQTGRFGRSDTLYVWAVLAGSAVGLLATSLGRLYSSAFYALYDTRSPLNFAMIRVVLTTILGFLFAFWVPHWLHIDAKWGIGGLTASAGIAGWVEFSLLRRALASRIGEVSLPVPFLAILWGSALLGAGFAFLVKLALGVSHPLLLAVVALAVYAALYLGGTYLLGIAECKSVIDKVARRLR